MFYWQKVTKKISGAIKLPVNIKEEFPEEFQYA